MEQKRTFDMGTKPWGNHTPADFIYSTNQYILKSETLINHIWSINIWKYEINMGSQDKNDSHWHKDSKKAKQSIRQLN